MQHLQAPDQEEKEDLIPTDAYLFFPKENEKKNPAGVRLIFEGNTKYDDREMRMIDQFELFAKKNEYELLPIWKDSLILRFLQANAFNFEKTLISVKEHTTWRQSKLPVKLTDQIKDFLEKGYFYVHGRDHRFRPIIVFRAYLLDLKTFDVDLMIDAITYFLEFIIERLLLPGQVENWVFITDLNGMGLSTIPLSPIRRILNYLQHNYRGRLSTMYIINTPPTVYIPWQMAKKFIEETTINKIQFYKKQIPEPMFQHVNRSQVEQKYGGTAPNIDKFWPPEITSYKFFISTSDAKNVITKEEYINLFQGGKLEKFKVNMDIISHPLYSEYVESCDTTPNELPVRTFGLAGGTFMFGKGGKTNTASKNNTPYQIKAPEKKAGKPLQKLQTLKMPQSRNMETLQTEGGDFKDNMNENINHFAAAIPQFQCELFEKVTPRSKYTPRLNEPYKLK